MLKYPTSTLQSALDVLPLAVFAGFLGLLAIVFPLGLTVGDPVWMTIAFCFVSPLANGIWAQTLMTGQIKWLCDRTRREELSLTRLDPRSWLRSSLRRRLIGLHALPALNIIVIFPAYLVLAIVYSLREGEADPIGGVFLIGYFLGSMQICAIAVSLAGVFELIEKSCRQKSSDGLGVLIPLKWSLVLLLSPPAVIFVGGITIGIGLIPIPVLMCFYFTRRARRGWNDAVASYFKFE